MAADLHNGTNYVAALRFTPSEQVQVVYWRSGAKRLSDKLQPPDLGYFASRQTASQG